MKWVIAFSCLLMVAGCSEETPRDVQALVDAHGCGSCHRMPGIPGATGRTGPPLKEYHRQVYVAGILLNTRETLARFIEDPQAIDPRSAMPNVGVTAEEATLLADYLRSEP